MGLIPTYQRNNEHSKDNLQRNDDNFSVLYKTTVHVNQFM